MRIVVVGASGVGSNFVPTARRLGFFERMDWSMREYGSQAVA